MGVSTLIPVGIHHPLIQKYLLLRQQIKSCPENLAAIEGSWIISLALGARLEIAALFVCPELLRGNACKRLVEGAAAANTPSYVVSEKVMRRLAEWDGPDGLAAIVVLPRFGWHDIPLRGQNRLLVLDGLDIPGNIGTIIRCADGAGADAIIMTNRKKRLSHPRLIHASIGAVFTFPIIESDATEAIAWLKRHAFKIVTTDTSAPLHYRAAAYTGRVAVIMGNERHGISSAWQAAQDMSVAIPMHGRADSLNVGNAAVLMLYEVAYQHMQVT